MTPAVGAGRCGFWRPSTPASRRTPPGRASLAAARCSLPLQAPSPNRTCAAAVPCVLLDVPLTGPLEAAVVAALLDIASDALVTVPWEDDETREHLASLDLRIDELPDERAAPALSRLAKFLFSSSAPPLAAADASVQLFSAPGEGRECLEMVRRMLACAADGIRFDEMAVLVRSPEQYIGLLEHACARAGVPAWFDRGTRRPDPAGRALLALLACANEDLSARRFAEYPLAVAGPDGRGVSGGRGHLGALDGGDRGCGARRRAWGNGK